MTNINWHAIRPINGSQTAGFEEFCVQLADVESPSDSEFKRVGTPDGGVECYATLEDGSEWGWQAKYVHQLEKAQWSEIDKSVKRALETHPELVRYFVCVPKDLADARIEGRMSAMERWNNHVQRWTEFASSKGLSVEFIYWGSHELLDRLSRPENVGKVRFWFDTRRFDAEWFTARLEESIKTAGPRYTPEIHIDLPIADEFETFGRTELFFDQVKAHAQIIRSTLLHISYSKFNETEPTLEARTSTLVSQIQTILKDFSAIQPKPVGELSLHKIIKQISVMETNATELKDQLWKCAREYENKPKTASDSETSTSYHKNPYQEFYNIISRFTLELKDIREIIVHAESVAGHNLLILHGDAGTGKTHLLCDVAQRRIKANQPTVLLMGQRFINTEDPWIQIRQQLDLSDLSVEEFIGALEAATQVSGCRALVIIDAINEGKGRLIWPNNLAAFLAHLERSPWIGVVLSVRSSYEKIIIPKDIRICAVTITHNGFAKHEYDATRTFFTYYGLEFPSAPLLAPEFRNPLFLKTLCRGLREKGECRLPRGFHGITAIFDLYLNAINKRLALESELNFNQKKALVRKALEAFAEEMVNTGERWVSLDRAEEIVNALLPGREFEHSLYRGLIVEGLLVEETKRQKDENTLEVVFFGYERLADHLVAKNLIDIHLNPADPIAAFEKNGGMAFFSEEECYISPGLLEAMCIQIPERTGQEFVLLVPKIRKRRSIGHAFNQSLVWRNNNSFSENTLKVLNELHHTESDLHETLDALLTVTTISGHPLNAILLYKRLKRDSMPIRDAWWSIYLHYAWRSHGAVDRIVDWASSVTPKISIDEETVDLCAIALSWMFTTSNRFLRDRATKALVSLLTGRLDAVIRLIERFADVDDPYVMERVYAVAYGTAMRNHDPVDAGALAQCVYNQVFATGSPPAHILLRDYARGVIERALYLGSKIDIVPSYIRPPYSSQWPNIPSEADIKPLLPDWSRQSHDNSEIEWGRDHIGSSVMDGDFARYVIGTNSLSVSRYWLSLGIDEPTWQSLNERISELLKGFSEEEKAAWVEFKEVDERLKRLHSDKNISSLLEEYHNNGSHNEKNSKSENIEDLDKNIERTQQEREEAFANLTSLLTDEHAQALTGFLTPISSDDTLKNPPRFDIHQIQRYILWRVFDLGWTTDRFGKFDRFSKGYHGREAGKAERIGKKYQWIAYHEILAFIADHYQYREEFHEDNGERAYEGPWQCNIRDIDPSCTLNKMMGGTPLSGHTPAWWGSKVYDNWEEPNNPQEWVECTSDIPSLKDVLIVSHPDDGSRWVNLEGSFHWKQKTPPDKELTDVEHRELWYLFTAYLIQKEDTDAFIDWAKKVNFWGRWMPESPEANEMFLGEYGWSPAFRHFQDQYRHDYGDEEWRVPGNNCPVKISITSFEYSWGAGGFDCSIDDTIRLQLPLHDFILRKELQWGEKAAEYLDATGTIAAYDPTALTKGPTSLLIREDLLREYLKNEDLTLCWVIIGEKRVLNPESNPEKYCGIQLTGAFVLTEEGNNGFLDAKKDEKDASIVKSDEAEA